ncbi:hypothetical protein V8E55_005218 [Tylopilus felleus]
MGYVETLFGHQNTIVSIDTLRDQTLWYWTIPEESQLVVLREPLEGGAFERHESGEDGKGKKGRGVEKPKTFISICLWSTQKKTPIFTQALCHGLQEVESSTKGVIDSKLKSFSLVGTVRAPGVVNSLQLLPAPKGFLDSTSWADTAHSDPTGKTGITIPAPNGRSLTVKITGIETLLLVAELGQEHQLGRWLTVKDEGVVNATVVVTFRPRVGHDV